MICKNEEETIGAALDSVRPICREMVVVDTGSTDRTVEIARQHGARVEHFDWIDDFSGGAQLRRATSDFGLDVGDRC